MVGTVQAKGHMSLRCAWISFKFLSVSFCGGKAQHQRRSVSEALCSVPVCRTCSQLLVDPSSCALHIYMGIMQEFASEPQESNCSVRESGSRQNIHREHLDRELFILGLTSLPLGPLKAPKHWEPKLWKPHSELNY